MSHGKCQTARTVTEAPHRKSPRRAPRLLEGIQNRNREGDKRRDRSHGVLDLTFEFSDIVLNFPSFFWQATVSVCVFVFCAIRPLLVAFWAKRCLKKRRQNAHMGMTIEESRHLAFVSTVRIHPPPSPRPAPPRGGRQFQKRRRGGVVWGQSKQRDFVIQVN